MQKLYASTRHLLWLSGSFFSLVIILCWGWIISPYTALDDAYITYRYAHNLQVGNGFVYNPGEAVLGTTTPLYTFILAGLGHLTDNYEWLSHWLGIACWMVAALTGGYYFIRRQQVVSAIFFALMIATMSVLVHVLGMETHLLVALMLLCFLAWTNGWTLATVMFSALLLLTRQDAALWLLGLGFGAILQRRAVPWKETMGTLLLTLPWFTYAYIRFGTILPNSAAAKIGQNQAMASTDPNNFLQSAVTRFFVPNATWLLLLLGAIVVLGVYKIIVSERSLIWLPLWLAGYLLIYEMLEVANFSWYFAPVIVAIFLLAAFGVGQLAGEAQQKSQSHKFSPLRTGLGLLLAALFVAFQFQFAWQADQSRRLPTPSEPKYIGYELVGDWLAKHARADATVATIEIGILGYRSQRSMIDLMGLISPEMRHHLTGWTDILVYSVTQYWPDYIVTLANNDADNLVIQAWWFTEYYQPVVTFSPVTLYQLTEKPINRYSALQPTTYTNGLEILGVEFSAQRLTPGKVLDAWIRLRTPVHPLSNLQITASLVDVANQNKLVQTTVWPYGHYNFYPSSHWRASEVRVLPVRLVLPTTLSPGVYQLELLWFDELTSQHLTLAGTSDIVESRYGWLRYGDPTPAKLDPDWRNLAIMAHFDDAIVLENIYLPPAVTVNDAVLPVILQWTATRSPTRDLTIFVHLLDGAQQIIAQYDYRPSDGRFPTAAWFPGEKIIEQITLPLPQSTPPGSYALRIGLYDSGGRVTVTSSTPQNDSVLVDAAIQLNK